MHRLSFLLSVCCLVLSSNVGLCDAAAFSSPSSLHDRLLSLRDFRTLTAPDPTTICSPLYGCLPAGFPVPDPSTVQYIQFPGGLSINLQGFGTASLPAGYPVQDLPTYDSSSNTITDPVLSAILSWSLSTEANPNFNPSLWNGFSNGFSLPTYTGLTGAGGVSTSNNGGTTGAGVNENQGGGGATAVVINGNGSAGNGGSAAGSTINTHPTTGTTAGGGTTTISGSTTTSNNGGTTTKNGASALAASISLVVGLAVTSVCAALL